MHPAVVILGVLGALFTACAFLPVLTSAFFGYRTAERLAIGIGAVSGLLLLTSCVLLAYVARFSDLSREDTHLAWFGIIAAGVLAACAFSGTFAGYIAMGFLSSEDETN
jgi:hypothetical protein